MRGRKDASSVFFVIRRRAGRAAGGNWTRYGQAGAGEGTHHDILPGGLVSSLLGLVGVPDVDEHEAAVEVVLHLRDGNFRHGRLGGDGSAGGAGELGGAAAHDARRDGGLEGHGGGTHGGHGVKELCEGVVCTTNVCEDSWKSQRPTGGPD